MAEQFSLSRSLSASAPRITRAASRPATQARSTTPRLTRQQPQPQPEPQSEPEPEDGIALSAAKSFGRATLSGLSMLGNVLDLPGSMIRDVLVADNPFDQLLDPLSHQSTGRSASGRDVLARNFLTSALFTPNKETGISGWADDPMEGVQDVAGFATELALDPLAWMTAGTAKAPGFLGGLKVAAKTPARAGKLGKLDKGLQIINELDPGTHVGRALGIPQALAKRARAARAAKMFESTAGPERERVYSELKDIYGDEKADAVIRTGAARAATWAQEGQGRTPDEFFRGLKVQKSTPGEVGAGALQQNPADTTYRAEPFYSKIMEAVDAGKVPNRVGREQLEKTLTGYGVKQEELADMQKQLDELFAAAPDGKVSKDDVFDLAAERAWSENTVKVLSGDGSSIEVRDIEKLIEESETQMRNLESQLREARQAGDIDRVENIITQMDSQSEHYDSLSESLTAAERNIDKNAPKFAEYQVPGGIEGTYREILIQNPGARGFNDPHFGSVGDVLVHIRADDYQLPDGSKAFRIQEIQSDLHQKGSKEGYGQPAELEEISLAKQKMEQARSELSASSEELREFRGNLNVFGGISEAERSHLAALEERLNQNSLRFSELESAHQKMREPFVPDAPFKKAWPELAAKTAIRQAAELGHDKITIVKGADIAEAVGGPPEALGKFYDEKMTNIISKMVKKAGGTVEKIKPDDVPAELLMADSVMNNRGDILKNGTFLSKNYKNIEVRVNYAPDAASDANLWNASILNRDGGTLRYKHKFTSPDEAKAWAESVIPEIENRGKQMTVFTLPQKFRDEVLQKGQTLYQKPTPATAKGAIEFSNDNEAIIHIFENGDVSTAIHEFFHYFRRELPADLLNQAADAIGVKSFDGNRAAEEAFASMGEQYALEGKAPTPALRAVFEKFKEWMTNIYSSLDGTPLDNNIHPNLRQVFDDMLGGKEAAENMPTTMADRAFEALDGYASIFQAKATAAVNNAYAAAPQPVKATADFIRTEAGQKVDALTRWTMSAFNNRVDDRMTEAGQQSAKVMTGMQDDLIRKFSEPVIQTLSDIAHYGPDGTASTKAALRDGQTIEDWHSEFSESLRLALETGDTEPLARLAPAEITNPAENPFTQAYERLKTSGDRMLAEQRAAGVVIGDLSDVIDHMYRQMNPRLADWRQAREVMPDSGSGTGKVTREDLFRGFYNGTGGKVASGANRITSDPDVLNAVRQAIPDLKNAKKEYGPSAAGKAVAKVIEQKYAGDVDPRMPSTTPSGEYQFRDPSKEIASAPATPTTPAVEGMEAPLFTLSRSDLSTYYRRVPETAERDFSTAAGDAFDLAAGQPFDLANPLHRAEVFTQKMPIKFEKTLGDPSDPRWKDMPDTIHQEFDNRWEQLGQYLWGSDDATRVQQMTDHINAIEANGGIFGRHILINQQRYNQMAAKRTATARHFTDVFEAGLKTGEIRNPDALTPQALRRIASKNIERSAGVRLGDIFDTLEGSFDRNKIYQNSYDRLAKADRTTFNEFMKPAQLPEGLEDIADDLAETEMAMELDIAALRKYMDNLVVDQDLARELKGLHKSAESPASSMKKFKEIAATLSAQWKAGVLSFPSTQSRNYFGGIFANQYSGIWSGISQMAGEDVLFNRANDLLQEIPEIVAYMKKRGLDTSDPLSPTRAAREMYAIEKGHLASMSRDFVGQANSADDFTDLEQMMGLLPGHRNIRSRWDLATEYLATLAGRREASWKNPFDIAGTTRFLGPNKGTVRRESNSAPVSAINIWGKASDDANRLTGWIEGMRQGKSARAAFKRAEEVQLNYDPSKFTDFERKLKAIFPFYSFFSRETAYFANELMTNPAGKLGKLIRLMNSSQTDEYLPEHVREGGAIPFGSSEDGTENYLTNFGLMFEDIPKTLIPNSSDDLARNLLSKTNPLIKGPVEYALGVSSFQGGPMGGRDLGSMDPLLGRILTQLGIQDSLPNQNARPAFNSPMLEHALANSPLSRLLSTTKTLLDSPERKSILDKALITLTGMRITSVSPEQRQRGIREITNKLARDLGARSFETDHFSPELIADAKENDPEKYQQIMDVKNLRAHWDAKQRIKKRELEGPTKTEIAKELSGYLKRTGEKMDKEERKARISRVHATSHPVGTDSFWELLLGNQG